MSRLTSGKCQELAIRRPGRVPGKKLLWANCYGVIALFSHFVDSSLVFGLLHIVGDLFPRNGPGSELRNALRAKWLGCSRASAALVDNQGSPEQLPEIISSHEDDALRHIDVR